MLERRTLFAIWVLTLILFVQTLPRLSGITRPTWASDASFPSAGGPIVSSYDETWEAIEFLGHDLTTEVDFKEAPGGSQSFVVADIPQRFLDRSVPLKSRVLWRRQDGNSATMNTLMVTKWRVTGHIHSQ
jgi:hypothetical protein